MCAIHPLRYYHRFRARLCGTDRKRMTHIRAAKLAHATHGQTALTTGAIQHTVFSPSKVYCYYRLIPDTVSMGRTHKVHRERTGDIRQIAEGQSS